MEELMKYNNIDLEDGLKKEWILTNGIGGFASSTISRSQYKKVSWVTNSTSIATSKKIFGAF